MGVYMANELNKNNCEGCYDRYTNRCTFSDSSRFQYEKTNVCPCSICLVKVICVKSCEEYNTFWKVEHGIRTLEMLEMLKDKK